MTITVDLVGFDELLADMQTELERAGDEAMQRIDELIVDEARASHAFSNRTGDLESRIVPGVVTGSLLDNTLTGEVLGDMPYGQYLEDERYALSERFAFLKPAFARRFKDAEQALEDEFTRALLRVL